MGERRIEYRVLAGKSEENRPLGSPSRRWEDNIKIGIQGVGWSGMDCIDLATDRAGVLLLSVC
jgi:hypothetical protein